jgi:hypothetical protein
MLMSPWRAYLPRPLAASGEYRKFARRADRWQAEDRPPQWRDPNWTRSGGTQGLSNGEEAFEIAAAVAAIGGLAVLLLVGLMGAIFVWRLFRQASQHELASTRAVLAIEDLSRRLANQAYAQSSERTEAGGIADLRRQAESLLQQQQKLQETARELMEPDADALAAGASISELESAVARLDSTVGDMAASLANLIHIMEREAR